MKSRIIFLVVACLVAMAAIIGFTTATNNTNPNGTVNLTLSVPDQNNLSITINGKGEGVNSLTPSYSLAPGSYALSVTKTGYRSFSTEFSLSKNQTIEINVSMQPNATTMITNPDQIQTTPVLPTGTTIQKISYFYQNTWAVILIQANGSNAILVAQYNPSSQTWSSVLGPGTYFPAGSISSFPKIVVTYLQENNYVEPGAAL